jgi:type VI secretion system protein VasI
MALEQALSQEILKCSEIQSDLMRLSCFDQIAGGLTSATGEGGSNSTSGAWRIERTSDPLTDAKVVILALVADGNNAMLILRCKSGSNIEVFINWNEYLGTDVVVTSRVGQSPAVQLEWSVSTDKKATFYPQDSRKLVEGMLQVDKYVAQVTPYNENPVTATFSLTGLGDVATELFSTCKTK